MRIKVEHHSYDSEHAINCSRSLLRLTRALTASLRDERHRLTVDLLRHSQVCMPQDMEQTVVLRAQHKHHRYISR